MAKQNLPWAYYVIIGLVSILFLLTSVSLVLYLAGSHSDQVALTPIEHAWGLASLMIEVTFLTLLLRRKKAAFTASILLAANIVLSGIYQRVAKDSQNAFRPAGLLAMAIVAIVFFLIPLKVRGFRNKGLLS